MIAIKVLYLLLITAILLLLPLKTVSSYWIQNNPKFIYQTLQIGEWLNYPIWTEEDSYVKGDIFIYDNRLWIVRHMGHNHIPPIEDENLHPHGPYNEITIYWRYYNTYIKDDSVYHEGHWYKASHNGMSGIEPSTEIGWQRLSVEWFEYNIYRKDDIVIYEGVYYQARYYTQGDVPTESDVWIII